MERQLDPRLKALYDSGTPVYSISRLDCINHCLYEAYLTYKMKQKPKSNIYAILGGRTHDVLEGIVNGTNTEEDLWPAVEAEFNDLDMMGIEFPKDFAGNDTIRDGWLANMKHFCKNYKSPRGKNLKTEELFIYTSPKGHKLIGYIDLQRVRKDGSVEIYDYKTSSMYKGDDLKNHGRQLVVYALGLEQMGVEVKKVAWIMLKYVTVTYEGYKTVKSKKKTLITKNIERRKIATELRTAVARELTEQGFDEIDSGLYLDSMIADNSLDGLPESVRTLFTIKPCVVEYELTPEIKAEVEEYIDTTADMWEALGGVEENHPPVKFTKVQKNGKEVPDVFYCTKLCGHFQSCPHIKTFLDQLSEMNAEQEEEAELFS